MVRFSKLPGRLVLLILLLDFLFFLLLHPKELKLVEETNFEAKCEANCGNGNI